MVCSIVLTFLLFASGFLNPRHFHNLFRSTTYEEYIRSKYTTQMGSFADLLIDKYKNVNEQEAEKYFQLAILNDSLKDFGLAMRYYNKSIDQNPDNPVAYHRRGFLKLNSPELDIGTAYDALKDFNRAIKLDTTFIMAYFHRSIALGYLNEKARSFVDRKKVWEKDSLLSEEEFTRRYGISKKSFLIPFHS